MKTIRAITFCCALLLTAASLPVAAETDNETPVIQVVTAEVIAPDDLETIEVKDDWDSFKGYCTWYVNERYRAKWGADVPWGGMASRWYDIAQEKIRVGERLLQLANVGKSPIVDAIVVTSEGGEYGHVAWVTGVTSTDITVSEMNYGTVRQGRSPLETELNMQRAISVNFGKVTTRVIPRDSKAIKGYIYSPQVRLVSMNSGSAASCP